MGGSSSTEAFSYDQQLLGDAEAQSVIVEGDVRRLKGYEGGLAGYPPNCEEKADWETVYSIFEATAKKVPDNMCLGERKWVVAEDGKSYDSRRGDYVWETYSQTFEKSTNFGKGLVSLGAKKGDNIGIFSNNCALWVASGFGFYSQSIRITSLYATLGADAVQYIAEHAELEFICVSVANLPTLLGLLEKLGAANGGKLTHVILYDGQENWGNTLDKATEADVKTASDAGVKLLNFSEVVAAGVASEVEINAPTGEDIAFIMYTSGTTGAPKGAMLSHRNIACVTSSVCVVAPMYGTDVYISYLPLAHIFETAAQTAIYSVGGRVGFYQGNVKLLTADFLALRPTLLCGVPRVFDKIYKKVFSGIEDKNCAIKWFFNRGYSAQCDNIRNGAPRDASYDAKLFNPIAEKVGLDKCRMVITGAAPCPPYLMEFLRVLINCTVLQGYGMTESSAAISVTKTDDVNMGHVGPPLPCNEVKLDDVKEMNYTNADKPHARGEICVRGPNVFQGYYKSPEKTEEAVVDGWLHTGDIGRWNPNGTLSIIDRKKNIFKLSQGEYIAAEKIEIVYGKCGLVGQCWVYGNSFKSFVLAVVVPNAEPVWNAAKEHHWVKSDAEFGSPEFLTEFKAMFEGEHKDALKKFVFDGMKAQNKNLKGFEKVRDIIIEAELDALLTGFTEANQCMTPTFKLKRPQLLKRYVGALKQCYTDNGETPKADEVWPGEN